MKDYLLTQYKHYFDVAAYFHNLPGRANRDAEIEYNGMRYAIGNILTDRGYMTENELRDYHTNLLLN
jgi:hypothetical protein